MSAEHRAGFKRWYGRQLFADPQREFGVGAGRAWGGRTGGLQVVDSAGRIGRLQFFVMQFTARLRREVRGGPEKMS